MTSSRLNTCRILIVEDEYLLADELQIELERLGAIIVGPAAGLSEALAIIESNPNIDGAVLDANLKGEMVFPAAEQLQDRGIPFLFVSGYDAKIIPARFSETPRCEKPIAVRRIVEALIHTLQNC